jgi:excisionase family DNA binding protein
VTIKEAAQRLDLSTDSIRRELATGRLGCCRVGPGGRRIHITEADIANYLDACRVQPVGKVAVPRVAPVPPMSPETAAALERARRRESANLGRNQ